MNKPVVTYFDSPQLNEVGAQLIENYKSSATHVKKAHEHMSQAVIRRWRSGKLIAENHDKILEECGSQRAFSEKLGITEAMLSNDKRAYLALKDEGANTEQEVLDVFRTKGINDSTRNWEKLPRLLSEPESERQKDNRAKDEKRLQQLYDEVEEIRRRNQNEGGSITDKAEEIESYVKDLEQSLNEVDPKQYDWKSRYYLDWVKSLGMDFISMQPAENLDPHHTTHKGSAKGVGQKLPDVFTIPVTRENHNKIERGNLDPSERELADALIRTMALFIITHFKSD